MGLTAAVVAPALTPIAAMLTTPGLNVKQMVTTGAEDHALTLMPLTPIQRIAAQIARTYDLVQLAHEPVTDVRVQRRGAAGTQHRQTVRTGRVQAAHQAVATEPQSQPV